MFNCTICKEYSTKCLKGDLQLRSKQGVAIKFGNERFPFSAFVIGK